MGFLKFLGASLAAMILYWVGGIVAFFGLIMLCFSGTVGLMTTGVTASREAIASATFMAQVTSGVVMLIGAVMVVTANYIKKKHL